MNDALETRLRDELRDLAGEPLPASDRIRIATARARGTRTRRARRTAAVAAVTAACVAIAGVSYSVLDDGGSKPGHTPPAQGRQTGAPSPTTRRAELRTLPNAASFGWLPDGYQEYGHRADGVPTGFKATVSAAEAGFTDMQDSAPIQLVTSTSATLSGAPGPLINGKRSLWINQPKDHASGDSAPAGLAWQYGPQGWAFLSVNPRVTQDVTTIARIARASRFAPSPEPMSFPLLFRGVKGGFEVIELHTSKAGSGAQSFGAALIGQGSRKSQRLWVEVSPRDISRHELPTLEEGTTGTEARTTAGPYQVRMLATKGYSASLRMDEIINLFRNAAILPRGQETTNPFE